MPTKERLRAAAEAELHRVADRLAAQAPCRELRPSIVPPTPEQVKEAHRRIQRERRLGQPDIHVGPWPPQRRPWLRSS